MPVEPGATAASIYREHEPHPALRRHVECYWTVTGRVGPGQANHLTVLPDGCMDILFNFGDPPLNGGVPTGGGCAVGTMTRALEVGRRGQVDVLGVRFRPGAATPFLPLPASELTDTTLALDELWGSAAGEAVERLADHRDEARRVGVLDGLLRDRLCGCLRGVDERVLVASDLVSATAGRVTVDGLAKASGLGRRQLERRFLAVVGTPPKVAVRVARFRAAVMRMHRQPGSSLSLVAAETGYADQAHFTREFKALAGTSPGRYREGIG